MAGIEEVLPPAWPAQFWDWLGERRTRGGVIEVRRGGWQGQWFVVDVTDDGKPVTLIYRPTEPEIAAAQREKREASETADSRDRHERLRRRLGAMTETERSNLGAHLQNAASAVRLPFWGNAVWPLDSLWLMLFDEDY